MSILADNLNRAKARDEFHELAVEIMDRRHVDVFDAALLIARHAYPSLVRELLCLIPLLPRSFAAPRPEFNLGDVNRGTMVI